MSVEEAGEIVDAASPAPAAIATAAVKSNSAPASPILMGQSMSSPSLFAVPPSSSSSSSSLPPLSLSSSHAAARRAAEQGRRIYSAVLASLLAEGAIRPRDEELLSLLRHQSHVSFAQHQATLRALGQDEASFEQLKRVAAEREQARLEANETQADETKIAMCAVCLSAPSSHICIPCGHLCMCSDCAVKYLSTASAADAAEDALPSASIIDSPRPSPRLRGLECIKCRAAVEHVYRAFI